MVFLDPAPRFILASSSRERRTSPAENGRKKYFPKFRIFLLAEFYPCRTARGKQRQIITGFEAFYNSFDSSMTVRSAPKFVSYTSSNPILRRAGNKTPQCIFTFFDSKFISRLPTHCRRNLCHDTYIFHPPGISIPVLTSCLILIAPVEHTARHFGRILHSPSQTDSY